MTAVTEHTALGTPVGAAKGTVHLFWVDNGVRAYGLCGKVLRGKLVERTGEEPTCQACNDEADWAAAKAAKFDHEVYARRRQLGTGAIAGSGMRYGSEVNCYAHLDGKGRATMIWFTNESGQLRRAEQIAREHYLTAWREHLAAKAEQRARQATRSEALTLPGGYDEAAHMSADAMQRVANASRKNKTAGPAAPEGWTYEPGLLDRLDLAAPSPDTDN